MSIETDEYDAYFLPIEPEELAAIEAATARALRPAADGARTPQTSHSSAAASTRTGPREAPSPPSPDEYDGYDLSEFTAEDFARIDALVLASQFKSTTTSPRERAPRPAVHSRSSTGEPGGGVPVAESASRSDGVGRGGGGGGLDGAGAGGNGGPRIQIGFERAENANSSRSSKGTHDGSTATATTTDGAAKHSPYEQFRSWNRVLSVTDLVGPSWCEVQYDYGLRQRRHMKLGKRPESFVSAEGKTITVSRNVAAVNDRTLTRGRSVHQVLEREIQPEAVRVDITSAEERWALRIINIINGIESLNEQGRCREIPVFGIVHDQVVTGIIDEIVREPIPLHESSLAEATHTTGSPNKRVASDTAPSSPTKSASKRSRQERPEDQPEITQFFAPRASQNAAMDVDSDIPPQPTPTQRTLDLPGTPPHGKPRRAQYHLRLSDTKTRRWPSLPSDDDTFASRIQLMLYHRLLSDLLSSADPTISSSQPLDFSLLWERTGVDPTRAFSDGFRRQTGLSPDHTSDVDPDLANLSCLNDLTAAWFLTVDRLNVAGIDNTLTLVYRQQPAKRASGKRKRRRKGNKAANADLSEREAQELAAAIQASISDVAPGGGGDGDLARAVFESLRDAVRSGAAAADGDGDLGVLTHPFGPPISDVSPTLEGTSAEGEKEGSAPSPLAEDPQLAWALQQSLLPRLEETPAMEAIKEEAEESSDGLSSESAGVVQQSEAPEAVDGELTAEEGIGIAKTAPTSPEPVASESSDEDEDITVAELETEAKILGTKVFELDDAVLDEYLASVLAWWHGQRPPEGVDVEHTRRCVTCEYREGCEWREQKAQEALQRYLDRGEVPSVSGSAGPWL